MSCFVEKIGEWIDAGYNVPAKGKVIYENENIKVYKVGFRKKYALIK